ncbi:MAG TPA: hypothetical protein VGI10_00385 [Polyangiaceae bacterium]|jgi:hypothetical protein
MKTSLNRPLLPAAAAVLIFALACSSKTPAATGGSSGGAGTIGTGGAGASGGANTGGGTGMGGSAGMGVGGAQAGTGGDTPVTVKVEISPPSATLAASGTQSFTATVTGATDTSVTWSTTGGAISSAGLLTAPATAGGYAVRATSVADPRASAVALVTVTGGSQVLDPFYTTPYVQVMTPMPGASYFAPATIRIWAHAPTQDGYASQVDFYLGSTMVGSAPRDDSMTDYYQLDVTGVAAGSYEVYARTAQADGGLESLHIPITVIDVPAHQGPTLDLTTDRVLSGSDNFELLGTPDARALLTSSNGSRIRSADGWSGHLTIQNADVIGLGSMDVASIDVTTSGTNTLEISGSVFDRTGPLALNADDQSPIVLRGDTFQPNILTPVSSEADYAGSHPSLTIGGNSSANKSFQANNVGVSFVRFSTNHWLVGGDHDGDGNIFLGVRAGMEFNNSQDITLRGNFSYHRYPYGWSQGHNLDFEGTTSAELVEHNIFRGSSWMIQSMDGEFRYNLLVDNINEAFFRYTADNTKIHHNVLVNVGYQRQYSPSGGLYFLGKGTQIYNNTVDVGGKKLGWFDASAVHVSDQGSARNNVFTGFAYQNQTSLFDLVSSYDGNPGTWAWAEVDYNCFYNPDTTLLARFTDPNTGMDFVGFGAHDCGDGSVSKDPKFSQPRVVPFPFGDGDIWARTITVSQILAYYRGMYTPANGSPLIDTGDPADDTGGARNTDIGAVGAGNAHPDDLFGTFGQ